nr:hypothetical protein [Tanacetum cinerariifolium]
IQPSTSKPQKKQKPKKSKNKDTQETQLSDPTDEGLNEENVPTQRVKRLEKKKRSGTYGLKRLYKVGLSARVESSAKEQSLGENDASKQGRNIADIVADAEITLVDETVEDQRRFDDQEMFDTSVLDDDEEFLLKEAQDVQNVVEKVIEDISTAKIEETVSTAALITTTDVTPDELTLAQALVKIKESKPKSDKVVIEQEPEQGATTTTITVTIPTPDSTRLKARGVVIFDEKEVRRLQDEIDEKDRLAEEKAQQIKDENLAWDNVQVMMDADYELAARLQEQKQGELTIEEKLRLFVEIMDKRKKHFEKLRAEDFDEVQKAFDKTMSWINSFVPMDSEVVKDKTVLTQESSSKKAGDKLNQERSKKQKVEDDKESEELKRCLEIIPDDEDDLTIDATPLSIKTLIIDYKIYKEGKKSSF